MTDAIGGYSIWKDLGLCQTLLPVVGQDNAGLAKLWNGLQKAFQKPFPVAMAVANGTSWLRPSQLHADKAMPPYLEYR